MRLPLVWPALVVAACGHAVDDQSSSSIASDMFADSIRTQAAASPDAFADVRGTWLVLDPTEFEAASVRITRDSIVLYDSQQRPLSSQALLEVEIEPQAYRGYVLRGTIRSFCMYFQPNGTYLNECCDDCPTPRIMRQ